MTLIDRVARRAASAFPVSPAWRVNRSSLCTFTFDDCPTSALENAGKMLEEAGVVATYFISGSMATDQSSPGLLRLEDLRGMVARGHEIGCHTFSHRSVFGRSLNELSEDFRLNADVLCKACGLATLSTFAYPFGEVSFRAKKIVSKRFAAGRGVRAGVNRRFVDLAELRALPIYHRTFSVEKIRRQLDDCKRKKSWVIFYTHDVCDEPTPWGCTTSEFRQVLNNVLELGIEILTLRSAIERTLRRKR